MTDVETRKAMVCDPMATRGSRRAMEYLKQVYKAAWAHLNHQIPGYVPSVVNAAFQPDLPKCLRFHEGMLIGKVIPAVFRYLSANPGATERAEFYHIPVG